MYEIAAQVKEWTDAGRPVTLARVLEVRGFSNREPAAAAAGTPGAAPVGVLLPGAAAERVGELLTDPTPRITELTIPDADAAAAGLACGGVARVLVTGAVPAELWPRLLAREPVCLVTEIGADDAVGATSLVTREAADRADPEVRRQFLRGISATVALPGTAVTALWPTARVVIVGTGAVADALAAQAQLLGWVPIVVDTAVAAETQTAALSPADGVVVLSHDRSVDGPALAAALQSNAGYLGALGSRATQDARRAWLAERGIEDLSRLHGPAGLHLGGSSPAEMALAIAAEMLATRSGASGQPLRERAGAIHR